MQTVSNIHTMPNTADIAKLQAELATISFDELRAAYRRSRMKFTLGHGFLFALQTPSLRKTLELQALDTRRKQKKQIRAQPKELEAA